MNLESKAVSVTFFEDRARVRRMARPQCEDGVNSVAITGVSAIIDDASLVVTSSQGEINSAQVYRFLEADGEGAELREKLKEEVAQARRERDGAADEKQRAMVALESTLDFEKGILRRFGRFSSSEGIQKDAWKESFESLDQSVQSRLEELHTAQEDLRKAQKRYERAQRRLNQASSAEPRLRARIDVQIEVDEKSTPEVSLEYIVPCAVWRPSHRARLIDGDAPSLEVTTLATVWQRTGEKWVDVEAFFSTARLSSPSTAPLLDDDVLRSQPKSEEDKKRIDAEFREQVVDELSDGRRSVDEMPGIDDGGSPLLYRALRPLTIDSDGEAVQIECHDATVEVDVEQIAYAELMDAPHLVAKGVWRSEYPLLAGPVELIRGTEFAGRTRQDFVAVGESLELGFGPDDAIRLQRSVDEKKSRKKITGRKRMDRKVHLYLSNVSGEERSFELVERVPVSELEEVTITVDGHRPDRDGFVHIPVTLAPRETRKLSFQYRIEMHAKVELSV